jgi:hypothetical protein
MMKGLLADAVIAGRSLESGRRCDRGGVPRASQLLNDVMLGCANNLGSQEPLRPELRRTLEVTVLVKVWAVEDPLV